VNPLLLFVLHLQLLQSQRRWSSIRRAQCSHLEPPSKSIVTSLTGQLKILPFTFSKWNCRNKDGELTPTETFTGFRALGYNLFMSFVGTFLVHFFFSWWTLDTWIPDPFFTIHIKNIHRCTHGSDSHVYDQFGTFLSDSLIFINVYCRRAKAGIHWNFDDGF
jgi:hypothetical protein